MRSPSAGRPEPERRLSPREVEAVLGRAIELHVRDTAGHRRDELALTELSRIGRELGLGDEHLRQALAEVDGGMVAARDWAARRVGAPGAGASRTIPRSAAQVQRELEDHLVERECMVVERRFPGRTVYVPASGVVAAVTRTTSRLAGRHPPLDAERLEVGVQPLAEGTCCVAISVDLTRKRRQLLAAGVVGGASGGVAAAVAAAALVAPPLALVGVPVVAAGVGASRLAYRGALAETVDRVGSLLDRLEHGELRRPRGRLSLLLS